MLSQDIRQKFLDFFKKRGHKIVPSSSLIPDDPSVLLTTAGMQQFKRYFTGELDAKKDFVLPDGKPARGTVSIQKSFRTSDIDEIGDESHLTFFEMLGNFSFGGYFKKEAIQYAHEFIVKEMGLKIDYVSVFEGDKEVPADAESEKIWKSLGITDIRKFGRGDNFWGPTGAEGPCGPTTEIYVNSALRQAQGKPPVEVWNIVFNEYCKRADGRFEKLKTPGIDTGMGLERLAMVSQNVPTIFETDLFAEFMNNLRDLLSSASQRIVADHIRAVIFLIADGVEPSNKERGYTLRRLITRVIGNLRQFRGLVGTKEGEPFYESRSIHDLSDMAIKYYGNYSEYRYLLDNRERIKEIIRKEVDRLDNAFDGVEKILGAILNKSMSSLEKVIIGDDVFKLVTTYGLPFEIIKEIAKCYDLRVDENRYWLLFERHQEISRAGAAKKFGGHGLILDTGELKAGNEEEIKKATRLHTATHLLNQALHDVLGDEVDQRGSDITSERARFDFVFSRKMTPEEIRKTENIVNEKVSEDLPARMKEMPVAEAVALGVRKFYKAKYPDIAKIYYIGKDEDISRAYSKEFCGGPHVTHTGEIGNLKIIKEEASSAGIRRIRATVE